MTRRLIIGPILIAALLGLVWLDEWLAGRALPSGLAFLNPHDGTIAPGVVLLLLGLLACARAGVELARMFRAMSIHASSKHLGTAAAAGVIVSGLTIGPSGARLWGADTGTIQATASALVVFLSMLAYIRHRDLKGAAGAVAAAIFAFVYMGVVIGFLLAIRREYTVGVMVAVVLTVKMCDVGALFTGVALGRHKLIPWISPGKTWEGLIGGAITSAGFAVLFVLAGRAWGGAGPVAGMPLIVAAGIGLVLGLVGQLGDLSASVVKRDAGVKDAGRLLPGMGGMVDVMDSLVIAGPVAYWLLKAFAASGV